MAETSGLNVKVNVDVSEAITGLKALQREAKRATQALAELNAAQLPACGDVTGEKTPVGTVLMIPPLSITVRNTHDIDEIARALADSLAGVRIRDQINV